MPKPVNNKYLQSFFLLLFFGAGLCGFARPTDSLSVSPPVERRISLLVERIQKELIVLSPPPFSAKSGDYSATAFESLRKQVYWGHVPQVKAWVQTCLRQPQVINNPEKWVLAKSVFIECLLGVEMYPEAYDAASGLVRYADSMNVKNKEEAYLPLARAAFYLQDYSTANSHIEKALDLAMQHGNIAAEAGAQLAAGTVARAYFYGNTHRAIPYYEKAIAAARKCGDTVTLIRALMLMHADLAQPGNIDRGFPYLEEAVRLTLQTKYIRFIPNILEHICIELGVLREVNEVAFMYVQSLAFTRRLSLPLLETHMYIQLTGYYAAKQMLDSALYYISRAKNNGLLAPGTETPAMVKARLHLQMGQYQESALLYNSEISNYLNRFVLQGQSSISRWETQLRMQDKERELEQNANRRKQLLGAVVGACLLLLITLWAFFRQRSLRRNLAAQNQIVNQQRQTLEASLQAKELLLKEIHHRVKNNLQVISSILELQTASVEENGPVKAAITEGQNRLKSIALIHQRLYQNEHLATVEFGGFVEALFSQIASVFKSPGPRVHTTFSVPETYLDIDTAVPLGLICNEVITNAYKYAFNHTVAPSFSVDLEQLSQSDYQLRLSDNGPGLPNELDLAKANTLGLKLIKRLSRQIGGEANYRFVDGAIFEIRFSVVQKER